jgi:hypothetical protein
MSWNVSRLWRWSIVTVVAGLVVSFLAAKTVRPIPVMPPPPEEAKVALPGDVRQVVERACRDCHSDETRWPWYAQFAPVSWMLLKDVEKGRKFMNFSRWGAYSKAQRMAYLASIAGAATSSVMPPRPYTLLHSEARITAAERQTIAAWARQEYRRLRQPVATAAEE